MAMKYYFPDAGEIAADGRALASWDYIANRDDPQVFAEEAARFYNSRHGWMDCWPIEIAVVSDDGSEKVFVVERVSRPEFYAKEK